MATPQPCFDASRPFSRADAVASGIPLRVLRTRTYRRLFTGVYVNSTVALTPALRAEAALVPFRGCAFASHVSAARFCGVPIPTVRDEHVSVVRRSDRRSRDGIICHYTPHALVRTVRGVRVSDYPQMFCELASLLPLVDLVVVADHLLRHRRITKSALLKFCATWTGAGARLARVAASYARIGVDSPMETRLRMLLLLAGLPEPVVNHEIRDDVGNLIRRYDLSYPSARLAIEYDGRLHIDRVERWESDLDRREASDDDGWRMLVVTSRGVYANPEQTVERVWRLLQSRRVPGTPTRLSGAWRPHFPVR